MRNSVLKKRVLLLIGTIVLTVSLLAAPLEAYAAAWSTGFSRIATNSIVNHKGYYGLQGLAFDTYTGQDGYCFTTTNNEKKIALIHFTMNSKGKCKKKKVVVYKSKNVGHANDATLFTDREGKKWILFTLYGSTDDRDIVSASNGETIELGAISIDEYNQGKAIVHECKVEGVFGERLNGKLTGIAYIGEDMFADEEDAANMSGPCFILNGGDKYIRAILTSGETDNSVLTLVAVGKRGRIYKPALSNGKAAKFQGISYHKGYIYMCADGKKAMPTAMLLCRIKIDKLFEGNDRYQKNTEVFQKKIAKQGKLKLVKNAPEAVFFTNLEGKSKLYVSVNRKNKKKGADSDAILRSSKTF